MSEFQDWIERNKEKFSTYDNREIRDLALVSGFDSIEVDQWFIKSQWNRRAV